MTIAMPAGGHPAPIVLFVYNRPLHTLQTITALKKNALADNSPLIIFSDGPKNKNDLSDVLRVRALIQNISGFKSVEVISHNENQGLAKNIIDGVSSVIKKYGRVIVLEDDVITNTSFLKFMNCALNTYADEHKVWHVSGWNYPIENDDIPDFFLWRAMNCWGWATWSDRWENFSKNPSRLNRNWTKKQKHRFDLDGSVKFWRQIKLNLIGKIDTWAIFWYATIFEHDGLCLNPRQSYIENIGFDGSGTHGSGIRMKGSDELAKASSVVLDRKIENTMKFPTDLIECSTAVNAIKKYHKKEKLNTLQKVKREVRKGVAKIISLIQLADQ